MPKLRNQGQDDKPERSQDAQMEEMLKARNQGDQMEQPERNQGGQDLSDRIGRGKRDLKERKPSGWQQGH